MATWRPRLLSPCYKNVWQYYKTFLTREIMFMQIYNSRLSSLLNKFFAFGLSHRKAFPFSVKMCSCVEIFILPLFGSVYHNVVRVYYDFVCWLSTLMYAAYILLLRRPYPLCLIKRPLRSPLMVVDVIFEQPFFFRYASKGGGKWFRNIECDFLWSMRLVGYCARS